MPDHDPLETLAEETAKKTAAWKSEYENYPGQKLIYHKKFILAALRKAVGKKDEALRKIMELRLLDQREVENTEIENYYAGHNAGINKAKSIAAERITGEEDDKTSG
ncbi:MAG: hypothetical protein ACFFCW_01985 [Candidatus Hodarchaeota archaeon]